MTTKKIVGVILAGGTGSRLWPLTQTINKHLLPVGPIPMIYHCLYKFLEVGIEDVIIVSGKEHLGQLTTQLGSGADFKMNLVYRVQDRAGGIAEALLLCENVVSSDTHLCVLLGDNVFTTSLQPHISNYQQLSDDCCQVLLYDVSDPERFGVAECGDNNRVTMIVEKPDNPTSNTIVVGVYFYPPGVFDLLHTLTPSARGELEITDLNMMYTPLHCAYSMLQGFWSDAGQYVSYYKTNRFVWENLRHFSYLKDSNSLLWHTQSLNSTIQAIQKSTTELSQL